MNESFQNKGRFGLFALYLLEQDFFQVALLAILHAEQQTLHGDIFDGPAKLAAMLQVLLGIGTQAGLRAKELLLKLGSTGRAGGKQMGPGIAGLELKQLFKEGMSLKK